MSIEYDEYLKEHIGNVKKAYTWLEEHLPQVTDDVHWSLSHSLSGHDESKYSESEYDAYDKYFYGGNRSFAVVEAFNQAWNHHIHNNPHHWQYWVLLEDDPKSGEPYIALAMPDEYIVEMICDWWSFSWKSGELTEIFDWYDKHKGIMKLHKNTSKTVESILQLIREELDMTKYLEGEENKK